MAGPAREQRGEPLRWCEQCKSFHRDLGGTQIGDCQCIRTINAMRIEVHKLNGKVEELRARTYDQQTQIDNWKFQVDELQREKGELHQEIASLRTRLRELSPA